jgi:hypothetical protein
MYAPFVLLFAPYWLGAIDASAVMIGGHVLMLPAMALVMALGMLRGAKHEAGHPNGELAREG